MGMIPKPFAARQGASATGASSSEVFLSPSLLRTSAKAPPSFEMKFLVNEEVAGRVESLIREVLRPDPFGDPARGFAYQTSTLYCDTPAFDVFRGIGRFGRCKHRLRRYGESDLVFLERKSRWLDRVKKRRSSVVPADLARLAQSIMPWTGEWFHRKVERYALRPVCLLAYDRIAYVGNGVEGAVRLTMDRSIRGIPAHGWLLPVFEGGHPILTDQVLLEFKFQRTLPAVFKNVIQSLGLTPGRFSKYRAFVRAAGLANDVATEPGPAARNGHG